MDLFFDLLDRRPGAGDFGLRILVLGLAQIVGGLGNCALPQHLLAPFQDLFLYFEVCETSLQFGLRAEELSDGEPEFDVVVFDQRIAG